jgi:hypothetical protein
MTKLVGRWRPGAYASQGGGAVRIWQAVSRRGVRPLERLLQRARPCGVRMILELEGRETLLTIEVSRRMPGHRT